MTSNTSSQQQAEYLARIALALTQRPAPQGISPDEEDLAALLDNLLSEPRRAEVISHLAHDAALYERWQQLLIDQDLWFEEDTASNVTSIASARAPRRPWWQPAGGFTAVAAALFAGWLVVKPGGEMLTLDQAYQQFSPELTMYLDEQPNMRALPVPMDDNTMAILAGVHAGQQSLKAETSFAGIGKAQLVLAAEEYQHRFGKTITPAHEWGRWLLLSDAICSAEPKRLVEIAVPDSAARPETLPDAPTCDDVSKQLALLQQRLAQ